jgi:heme oxygenase (biliverdin-producing, ferredoxin)
MAALDFSLPLATLLRTGTASAHEGAENTQGAGLLTRGELDKEEYVRFLMMLWHVYE